MIYIWRHRHTSAFFLLPLMSNWYVRKCLTAFLPFQFIFQDSWWVWCVIAKREENYSTPLVSSDSGNITWEQRRKRQGERGGWGLWGVSPKTWHAFFTTNEYFVAPVSVSSATHKTYGPFSTNKLSISKAFPVKMKDALHTCLQRLRFPFACQTYRVELIDICVVWIRFWLNISKGRVCFFHVVGRIHARGEKSVALMVPWWWY